MSKVHLPLLVEKSVGELQALRTNTATRFELDTRTALSKEGKRVTCTSGCSSCCYHPIMISILEGILIYRWLKNDNQWTLTLRQRLKQTADKQYGTTYEVWLLALIPCPLLDKDKKCSAYKARPLVCRTYYSIGDPHYCHPHRLGPETKLVSRADVVDTFHQEQERLLRQHGLQLLTMPIGAAVLLGERLCTGEIQVHEINRHLYQEYTEKG